jgi:hypothetical protein
VQVSIGYGTEFESILVEASCDDKTLMVGEIYRSPGSNDQVSVERFDSLLHSLTNFKGQIVIGTDQHFNFLNVQHHNKTLELLNVFIASGFFPTVTIPTRITHDTSSPN